MASESASLRLELNWQKTKIQTLGSRKDEPSTITVLRQEITVVEEFVYLGFFVHSTTPDISRCTYAESRQPDLEVKNLYFNQAEVV